MIDIQILGKATNLKSTAAIPLMLLERENVSPTHPAISKGHGEVL